MAFTEGGANKISQPAKGGDKFYAYPKRGANNDLGKGGGKFFRIDHFFKNA